MTSDPTFDCLSPALLRDRVVVITGASRGIGRAAALSLGRAGARVGAIARDPDALGDLEKEFSRLGLQGLALSADVTERRQLAAAVGKIRATFGPINALVANAGVFGAADVLEIEEAELDRLLAVNLKGTLYAMEETVPDMKEANYGKVLTVASPAAVVGSVVGPHYAASKGAILGLTRSAARQLAPHGVRVNCISPAARTDMFEDLVGHMSRQARDAWLAKFPIGVPTPEQVAGAYVFLCSAL
ncbi:MAG: 2-hydroxycyclohexanecarboxyl-CoA dehydrogenase, partial [Actinomycetota bacterium]|nr:2-hydroxycyclohexanecarboxyl-CoA dehydrogenase [Actinomycetota bacterium]